MKRYANYIILPEYRLILECCKGKASVKHAIKMKQDEISDALYDPRYSILVDFREFETILNAETTKSIFRFFDFLKGIEIKSKVAFLTEEPHQVVISIILKELGSGFDSIKVEVFSTVEAAAKYLGIPDEFHYLINNEIAELNKNTV
jgi:hypothetical protein